MRELGLGGGTEAVWMGEERKWRGLGIISLHPPPHRLKGISLVLFHCVRLFRAGWLMVTATPTCMYEVPSCGPVTIDFASSVISKRETVEWAPRARSLSRRLSPREKKSHALRLHRAAVLGP